MINRKIISSVFTYLVLIFLALVFVFPFAYMFSISLASDETVFKAALTLLPSEFAVSNYVKIFQSGNVGRWVYNSLIITVCNTLLQVFCNSLVAYGFARFRARLKPVLFMILLSTMMIPSQVTLIPQFILFRNMGWVNTMLPLIIPSFFGSAFYIFLFRQFIMRLPMSLDEAAKLDGLGYIGIYRKIILPLIWPASAAVAVLAVIGNWNWFFEPMIYLNDGAKYPLAIGVRIMSATQGNVGETPLWNRVFAACMILVIPMILIYFVGQKYMFEMNINAGNDTLK
jgi:multiple sugar transport system permease protein